MRVFDLTRPHKKLVRHGKPSLIIQEGHAYEFGSKKYIGPISGNGALLGETKGLIVCKLTGATFTNKEAYEKFLLKNQQSALIQAASKNAPKLNPEEEGNWTPSSAMLAKEASRIAEEAWAKVHGAPVEPEIKTVDAASAAARREQAEDKARKDAPPVVPAAKPQPSHRKKA